MKARHLLASVLLFGVSTPSAAGVERYPFGNGSYFDPDYLCETCLRITVDDVDLVVPLSSPETPHGYSLLSEEALIALGLLEEFESKAQYLAALDRAESQLSMLAQRQNPALLPQLKRFFSAAKERTSEGRPGIIERLRELEQNPRSNARALLGCLESGRCTLRKIVECSEAFKAYRRSAGTHWQKLTIYDLGYFCPASSAAKFDHTAPLLLFDFLEARMPALMAKLPKSRYSELAAYVWDLDRRKRLTSGPDPGATIVDLRRLPFYSAPIHHWLASKTR